MTDVAGRGEASCAIAAALDGKPWSLAGVIGGFEDWTDDECRPLHEGRAPVMLREGVPMVLRRCPYRDERHQRWMNVSALDQISHHLAAVEADIALFRAEMPRESPTWDDLASIVMDQTAQPALHMLERRLRCGRIPAQLAVGFKVAVGYSKPVRDLLELDLRGEGRAVSVEAFMAFVREGRHLVGAREVCAGPTNMVIRVTEALLAPPAPASGRLNPTRHPIARALALQTAVGIAWRLFDVAVERQLLLSDLGRDSLGPRTPYLRRVLDERIAALGAAPGASPASHASAGPKLPGSLSLDARERLTMAMTAAMSNDDSDPPLARALDVLLDHDDGAIRLMDGSFRGIFARRFASYLRARCAFVGTVIDLEFDIRRAMGFPLGVPVDLTQAVFPVSRALRWFELVSGHRFRTGDSPLADLTMRNQHRSVRLPLPEP